MISTTKYLELSENYWVEYRYGYQGSERDNEVKGEGNSYTTLFRQLDPRLGKWLSVDPKASKYPYESPYVSMGNNPIIINDVLGDDKYKVDKEGNISLKRKNNKDFDKIVGRNLNGKRETLKVDKGVLNNIKSGTYTYDEGEEYEKNVNTSTLTVYGDGKGKELFEFLARNTDVEFSFIRVGEGALEVSYVGTSHDRIAEATSIILLTDEYLQYSDVREFNHSHPGGKSAPSGSSADPNEPLEAEGRHGDVKTASYVEQNFRNKVILQIYTATDGKYTEYNSSTYIPAILENVNIIGRKNK